METWKSTQVTRVFGDGCQPLPKNLTVQSRPRPAAAALPKQRSDRFPGRQIGSDQRAERMSVLSTAMCLGSGCRGQAHSRSSRRTSYVNEGV